MESLRKSLVRRLAGEVRADEPLKRHTSYRIGGPADLFVLPSCVEDVLWTLRLAREAEVPLFVMGSGSNLLVSDRGFRGIVLRMGQAMGGVSFEGDRVWALAGVSLPKLAKLAADRGLAGLEWAGGVPGTVGGAVAMNAGAHGSDTSRSLRVAYLASREGALVERAGEDLEFAYRRSGLVRDGQYVVVAAEFGLERDLVEDIKGRMKEFAARRRRTQPLGMPSSGSVFKNPPGDHAGRLIEAASLKGTRVGGAQVSTVHGNFIVNTGGATADDVRRLIELVRRRVKEEFDVTLQLEVELVGWDRS